MITAENHARVCWSCGRDTGRVLAEQSPFRPQHKQAEACGECESKFQTPVQFPCDDCGREKWSNKWRLCASCAGYC